MATLTSILQLSTSGVAKDRVSFTSSKIANVKNPAIQTGTMDISSIATIATAPSGTTATDGMYMYIKNIDPTNFLSVTFDSNNTLKVGPGECTFFCVHDSRAVKGTASTGTVKIEYGHWTLDKY
jgi:hypothetical protein|tara:strand:- start:116 stop:487 length:372 start_codon:yes stop_codon:yes gene_type:complete